MICMICNYFPVLTELMSLSTYRPRLKETNRIDYDSSYEIMMKDVVCEFVFVFSVLFC